MNYGPPPSQFGATTDPATLASYEAQAQAMGQATLSAYGSLPDPQMVTEALSTGTGFQVAQLASQGSPDFSSLMSSATPGQPVQTPGQTPIPPANLPPTMNQGDWQSYWDDFHNQKSDQAKQWQSFGEMPIASPDYANYVRNGNKDEVSKWQDYLKSVNILDPSVESSGVWDDGSHATEKAFDQFMLQYFLPDALYSPDVAKANKASYFLSTLGFDPQSVERSQGGTADFRNRVMESWLQVQGPDVQMRDSISNYASAYGENYVPQQLLDLRGNWLSSVTDGISSILATPGNLIGMIPGVGDTLKTAAQGVTNPLDELLSGNVFFHPGDIEKSSRQARGEHFEEDAVKSGALTQAEVDALKPAIQQIQDGSGFLSFMDAWSRVKNQVLLGGLFWLEDAFKGYNEGSLWDPTSQIGQRIHKYADGNNVMAGIFGDQFAHDHTTLAALGNLGINMLDDPTTWLFPNIGELGLASKLAEQGVEATTVEKITAGLISRRTGTTRLASVGPKNLISIFSGTDKLQTLGNQLLRPMSAAQQDVAQWLGRGDLNLHEASSALGGLDLSTHMDTLQKLVDPKATTADRLNILRNTPGLSDRFYDGSYLANRREYMKAIRPENTAGLGIGKLTKMLGDFSGMHMHSPLNSNDKSGAIEMVETAMNLSYHNGMDAEKFRKANNDIVNALMTSKTDAEFQKAIAQGHDFVEQALGSNQKLIDSFAADVKGKDPKETAAAQQKAILDALDDFSNLAMNRGGKRSGRSQLYAVQGNADGVAKELSKSYSATLEKIGKKDPEKAQQLTGILQEAQGSIVTHMAAINNYKALADAGTPAIDGAQQIEQLKTTINGILTHLDETIGDGEAVPFVKQQEAQWHQWKYSPYELLAFTHPGLRKFEGFQRKYHVDKAMNYWKSIVLASPKTALKITLGDESLRGMVHLLSHDPVQFAKYMKDVAQRKKVPGLPPDALNYNIDTVTHGVQTYNFKALDPEDDGYMQGIQHWFNDYLPNSGFAPIWAKTVKQQLDKKSGTYNPAVVVSEMKKWLESDDPLAADFLRIHGWKKDNKTDVEYGAHQINNVLSGLVGPLKRGDKPPPLHQAMLDKQLDAKAVQKLMDTYRHDSHLYLPRIAARIGEDHKSHGGLGGLLDRKLDYMHHNVTQAWVNKARSRVFLHKVEMEKNRLRKWNDGSNERARKKMSEDEIQAEAHSRGVHWVKRNTYQMNKTLMGQAARSVYPFWGASANMDRFWLRAARENPSVIAPVLYTAAASEQAQQTKGGFQVPLSGALMKMMGMTNGDDLTWDPFHAMFLTSEGVNGFIPSLGPIISTPAKALAQAFPVAGGDVANSMIGQALLPNLTTSAPVVPWLERMVSGVTMAISGQPSPIENVPFLGRGNDYYQKQIDWKERQQAANALTGGPDVTPEGATRDVGMSNILAGIGQAILPANVQAGDVQRNDIQNALQQWDQAVTQTDRDKVKAANPTVAAYLDYIDPLTTNDRKAQIIAANPWVEAYSVGMNQPTGAQALTGAEPTVAQFQADIDSGRIRNLTPAEYLTKINKYTSLNRSWALYDNYTSAWQNYLQTSGLSATSPQALQWKAANIDPAIENLAIHDPIWRDQYAKTTATTPVGLYSASMPISSLATWEVLPQNTALETPTTQAWRAFMQFKDEAAIAIRQLKWGGGTKAEQDLVMQQLWDQVNNVVIPSDPSGQFKSQLDRLGHFNKVEDLVNFEAETGGIGPGSLPQ